MKITAQISTNGHALVDEILETMASNRHEMWAFRLGDLG